MRSAPAQEPLDLPSLVQEIVEGRHVPGATYRLQFHAGFTFRDALAIVPYLDALGITDIYASPILKAQRNSTHGYDIVDHSELDPALGTEDDFRALSAALLERGMGIVLDVVPNHMGISDRANLWWTDVLENGPASAYSTYFDIDWHPVKRELENKVLLPILGEQFGNVLENGELRLSYRGGAFFINYWETELPVAPETYRMILTQPIEGLATKLGAESPELLELQSILTALSYLPPVTERAPEKVAERAREKEIAKRRIAQLLDSNAAVRKAVESTTDQFNGKVGDSHSFDLLAQLIEAQPYRPAFWRVATEEINYRRFFDINELAAIRVERPDVFESTHQVVFRLLAEGRLQGLRIDHPDGLWNPPAYFRSLQHRYVLDQVRRRLGRGELPVEGAEQSLGSQVGRAMTGLKTWPLYVVAEKILAEGESLPNDWAVHGTTGYEFLNLLNGLFVDRRRRRAMDRIYQEFVGQRVSFANLTNTTRKMIMLVSLASEINSLAHQLDRIAERNRSYRDFTLNGLTFAIREVVAGLPVYRSYLTGPGSGVATRDRQYIDAAVAEAKRRNPRTAESIFDFIGDTLLLRNAADFPEEDLPNLVDFVMRFQQVTGPVMAKGVEDTAFYQYNRLVSLNEVGGNPEEFGVSLSTFHRRNAERAARWPHSMLTTSTHDTKRSEDVRARLDVLSELPGEWEASARRWAQHNRVFKTIVDGEPAPDRDAEYLIYQTIVGAWPLSGATAPEFAAFRDRIAAYALKATKEAKTHTSWVNPNDEYDESVQRFVRQILAHQEWVEDVEAFQRRVAFFGQLNSLSQVLLKLTSPGVPDVYQGTEVWDLSLVDPDNRRPVDYQAREAQLAALARLTAKAGPDRRRLARKLFQQREDGALKLFIVWQTLRSLREHRALYTFGSYLPLVAGGMAREHVCCFARLLDGDCVIAVAPRLILRLTGGEERSPVGAEIWGDTWLPLPRELRRTQLRDRFSGQEVSLSTRQGRPGIRVGEVLRDFPVALLERIAP